jgi:hypothetical protein
LAILPFRETPPPARWAAASACATRGLALWLREERMRPGLAQNRRHAPSPALEMCDALNLNNGLMLTRTCAGEAHIAQTTKGPNKSNQPTEPHIAAFLSRL